MKLTPFSMTMNRRAWCASDWRYELMRVCKYGALGKVERQLRLQSRVDSIVEGHRLFHAIVGYAFNTTVPASVEHHLHRDRTVVT